MSNYVRLSELIKSVSITHKFDKEELVFLNTSDVLEGKILINHYSKVSELKGQAKKTIKNGDILYSEIRPKNKRYAYVKEISNVEDYVVSTKLMVLRNNSKLLDTDYLYHFLTNEYTINYLQKRAENRIGSFPQITFDVLKTLQIRLPDNSVQKSIAKVLSDLVNKIELNNRINRELEAMAKTLYDYWFVQFDFPNPSTSSGQAGKPYKSSGGKMVYNAELKREIPEGWEVKTLLDIANYINGFACQNYRPTNEDYLPVIKIREMRDGITESTEKVKADIPDKLIVNDGDVLFSWSASLEVMIWSGGKGGLNQHIFKVTSKKYPRSFYYYQLIWYLQHFKMIAELRKTTMGHITQDHLKQSRIVIPPIEVVKALDEKIYPIQKKQILLHKQNQQLSELRDWLLPMLMNGQVTVKEAEERLSMAAEPSVEYKKG